MTAHAGKDLGIEEHFSFNSAVGITTQEFNLAFSQKIVNSPTGPIPLILTLDRAQECLSSIILLCIVSSIPARNIQ